MTRSWWPTVSGWDNIDDLIFMQDGAPPHFALTVRAWLDQHFSGRWLGRRGPHEWPPRSPDLTPCDFYLWGYTKEEVYKTKPRTLEDLEIRIQQVLNAIPNEHQQCRAYVTSLFILNICSKVLCADYHIIISKYTSNRKYYCYPSSVCFHQTELFCI